MLLLLYIRQGLTSVQVCYELDIVRCRSEVLPAADSALKCFFPSASYYLQDVDLKDQVCMSCQCFASGKAAVALECLQLVVHKSSSNWIC